MSQDHVTDAQINFALSLLSERDWTNAEKIEASFTKRAAALNLAFTWALNSPSAEVSAVATSSVAGHRVNQILDHCSSGLLGDEEPTNVWKLIDRKGASKLIDWLKSLPLKSSPAAPTNERVELEDGMYLFEDNYYKVQHAVHGSGNQYAKKAVIESIPGSEGADSDVWSVSFEYAPGVVAKLRPENKLSYEKAKEFGMIYGTCVRCGRTLTDELSIALGIGPVCGDREFGGEFKAIIKSAKLQIKESANA